VSDPRDELAALSTELRAHVERERDRGRTHLTSAGLREALDRPRVEGVARPAAAARPAARAKAATPVRTPAPAVSEEGRGKKLSVIDIEPTPSDYDERMAKLGALAAKASRCEKCGLCATRNTVVFARGRARNRVMFIGEAPGADEDRLGEPFVGRAGKLLDQILDAAGFRRDEIYIANILKCRPPNNRDPHPDEIAACTPYLVEQIELVNPKIICALGRFAAGFLTGQLGAPMGSLRGRVLTYQDRIPVLSTYHPAALLRNPDWKRVVWEDFQLLRREYLR
jgi:DNA polymerase